MIPRPPPRTSPPPRHKMFARHALPLALLLGGCHGAGAEVSASDAWIAATGPGQAQAAAYLTVANHGRQRALLSTIEAPGTAAAATLHRSTLTGGVMRMQSLDDGLPIEPGARITLAPMADHIMLTGLTHALTVGQTVPLVLHFDDASEVRLSATVRPARALAM